MAEQRARRKLAAILSADAVGYSRLMAVDEAATVEILKQYRAVIQRIVERHAGRVVNAPGDAVLAEFPSAVEAVQAAVEIQKSLEGRNVELTPERAMAFRIGVNPGDVIEEADGTIYGDGVNIAARMEALAEGGGICISSTIFDAVEGKLSFGFDFLGEQQVKNITKPIKVYRVRAEARPAVVARAKGAHVPGRWIILAGVAALIVVAIGIGTWWTVHRSAHLFVESTTAHAQPDRPTIAVLPFQNLSGDPAQEYFADGISDELITLLTQFRDLSVIARNSMFTYKGKAVDVRDVGREMHADFVLEGSVRRAADTIRVTAQLLVAKDGKHLWAETFERKLTAKNMFALQDEISERVATAIAGDYGIINLSRTRETSRKPPDQLQSYECVLRVYEYNRTVTPESRALATKCLEGVTTSDPQYADAWAWLAMVHIEEYAFGNGKPSVQLERGRVAVKRAFEADPSNSIAMTVEAYYLYFKRAPRFFESARKAALANARDFYTLAQMGLTVSWAGNWKEGRVLLDRAIATSPRPPGWVYLPISHRAFLDGDYRKGLEFGLKADMPGWYWYHVAVAPNYARLGMKQEARAEVALLQKAYPDFEIHAYEEFRKWFWVDSEIEALIQGLREAGMSIPPDTQTHSRLSMLFVSSLAASGEAAQQSTSRKVSRPRTMTPNNAMQGTIESGASLAFAGP